MIRKNESIHFVEEETRRVAISRVANLLQRPDQLEKLEQLKRKYAARKSAADALLKGAVQSNIDGVKTGLQHLRSCLDNIQAVKQNVGEIHAEFDSIKGLKDKLKDVSKESSRHQQLGSAVDSLKHIANVPATIEKTREQITNGLFLLAHRNIADLEGSRDQLLLELFKRNRGEDDNDSQLLKGYFGEVSKLSDSLAKNSIDQFMSRPLVTVRQEPAIIVTCWRIIEREERLDMEWQKRCAATGYMPTDRPKKWRERAIEKLGEFVMTKIEGCQLEEREQNRMWLARHLELIRKIVLDDLKIVKSLCEPCFPKRFDVIRTFSKLYHTAISNHLIHMRGEIEGNEIVTLLSWISDYYGEELMGHRGIEITEDELGPLLSSEFVEEIQEIYMNKLHKDISEWLSNTMASDKKDWVGNEEPESDGKGFYLTHLPIHVFEIMEQTLQVAEMVGSGVTPKVLELCMSEISSFANTYKRELEEYRNNQIRDPKQPYYIQYLMANVNNCQKVVDSTEQLKEKYDPEAESGGYGLASTDKYHIIGDQFHAIAAQGMGYLKDEVFKDIDSLLKQILSREWLTESTAVDTICYTIEDYKNDFEKLRKVYYIHLMSSIYEQVLVSYLRQLLSSNRRITFNSTSVNERREAGEKIIVESEQLTLCIQKLTPGIQISDDDKQALPVLSELLKMGDTSLVSLELSVGDCEMVKMQCCILSFLQTIITRYPDVKQEQLISLLLLRGDTTKSDAQKFVAEVMSDQPKGTVRKSILSKV